MLGSHWITVLAYLVSPGPVRNCQNKTKNKKRKTKQNKKARSIALKEWHFKVDLWPPLVSPTLTENKQLMEK